MRNIKYIILSVCIALLLSACDKEIKETFPTVQPVLNQAPIAYDDNCTYSVESPQPFFILNNDKDEDGSIDTQSIEIVQAPRYGSVVFHATDGSVVYAFSGEHETKDSFSYRVKDNEGALSNEATVTIVLEFPAEVVAPVVKPKPVRRVSRHHVREANNWYMKFSVRNVNTNQYFKCAKLGELNTPQATQKYALKAFGALGSNALDVVAKEKSASYSVYFTPYSTSAKQKHWQFEVRSSDTHADLELAWQGLFVLKPYTDRTGRKRYHEVLVYEHPLLSRMYMVDMNTSTKRHIMQEGKKLPYVFNMNSKKTRAFELVLPVKKRAFEWSTIKPLKKHILKNDKRKNSIDKSFDLQKPPMWMK